MYMFPKLRDGRSKKLRARMQGKACFNFKVGDEPLFKELEQLTAKGFASAAKRALDRDRAMPATITTERPDTADARALIEELEAHLATLYPQESRHGYSVEKLIAQGVAFFATRNNGTPVGCGGIQLFGTEYGELKRMYVPAQFRGLGFAKLMLNHLADFARSREVRLLRLETGIHQHAAIGLYERDRFRSIPPFGEYKDDPLSSLYEKRIV
jgi:GNAT superfamily N-acetyltransferase